MDEGAGQQLTQSFWGGKKCLGCTEKGERPSLEQSSFLEEVRRGGKRVLPEFLRRKMPDGTSMLLGDRDLKLQPAIMKK